MKSIVFILLILGVFFTACKEECKTCQQEMYGVKYVIVTIEGQDFLDSVFTLLEVIREPKEYCNKWDWEYLESKDPEYEWGDTTNYHYFKYDWICN